MEITNPDKSFDISKKESENNLVMFFPNLQEHQQAAKPWKEPSAVYSTPRVWALAKACSAWQLS